MADCTVCEAQNPIPSAGTTIEVQDSTSLEWLNICGIIDFSGPTGARGEIDVTTLCSTAKEYQLDLPDYGTLTINGLALPGAPSHMLLDELFRSGETANFRITLKDDGYGNGEVVKSFKARISGEPMTASQGDVLKISFTLRLTGDVATVLPTVTKRVALSSAMLSEDSTNDGAVSGGILVTLYNETFTGDVSDAVAGATFSDVPAGLTASCTKTGTNTAMISFAGAATTHTAGTTARVGLSFADASFTGGSAAAVTNSTGLVITINFI